MGFEPPNNSSKITIVPKNQEWPIVYSAINLIYFLRLVFFQPYYINCFIFSLNPWRFWVQNLQVLQMMKPKAASAVFFLGGII